MNHQHFTQHQLIDNNSFTRKSFHFHFLSSIQIFNRDKPSQKYTVRGAPIAESAVWSLPIQLMA